MIRNLILCILIAGFACSSKKNMKQSENNYPQGIEGRILWEEGNLMPSFDMTQEEVEAQQPKGVKREIYVFELVSNDNQKRDEMGFYDKIDAKLIAQSTSDEAGNFKISLAVGKYSLFVKEEGKFYANLVDGQNHIFPVEVKENEFTSVDFMINYKAVY